MMKVSVIVPTKNSEEFLALTLHDLENQTYPCEIIVVDNFSTDRTISIANKYTDKVYQVGPERASQDNFGVLKATGDIIWITGSDFRIDKNYAEQGVAKINEGYDAIYASVLTDRKVKHFWGKVKALERKCYIGTDIESARFFKKEVWLNLGGFDEKLVQIEEDFQHRIDQAGYKTGRIMALEYHLHEYKGLGEIFRKSAYYGSFMGHYLNKHKGRGYQQIQPFRKFNKFLKHPILLFGLIIYKMVQYSGGIWGCVKSSQSREQTGL